MAKVVDLNPSKRLSKEALGLIKEAIMELTVEDVSSLTLIYTPKSGHTSIQSYGMDFATVGFARAALDTLSQEMLADEIGRAED